MSDQLTLSAEARDVAGKGASRHLRREGRVPAVIYGDKKEPVSIHLAERDLMKALNTGHFMNSVVMIEGSTGKGGAAIRTLPKDVQMHPVSDRPLHVDFLRISEHSTVHVNVPLVFVDEELSPGIKRGGVLSIVHHELELIVDAADIPSEISVSLNGLEVGETIHLSQITLPAGAKAVSHEDDETLATLVAPSALKSSEGGETATDGDEAAGA
jgi:large subunit ribosomal protein L25